MPLICTRSFFIRVLYAPQYSSSVSCTVPSVDHIRDERDEDIIRYHMISQDIIAFCRMPHVLILPLTSLPLTWHGTQIGFSLMGSSPAWGPVHEGPDSQEQQCRPSKQTKLAFCGKIILIRESSGLIPIADFLISVQLQYITVFEGISFSTRHAARADSCRQDHGMNLPNLLEFRFSGSFSGSSGGWKRVSMCLVLWGTAVCWCVKHSVCHVLCLFFMRDRLSYLEPLLRAP